ncbi:MULTISPECIES: hypothetical protein [Streptomyces]|uniref:hypothetical protein n=1 Tax=Streptomyces TaxID=1883 RepID=UPI001BA89E3E|nr:MULTISPECIES: hypothetical protein [Streptomyces]
MQTFTVGQLVRTTVDLLDDRPGAFSAPVGTLGRIASRLDKDARAGGRFDGRYGVLLDGDPSGAEVVYDARDLAPV